MNKWFETIAALAVTAAWLGFAWSTDAGMLAEDQARAELQMEQSLAAQDVQAATPSAANAQEKALELVAPGQERQRPAPNRI